MSSNPHKGHRARLRKRFIEEGPDGFEQHEILELLLYYAIPQKDTNEIAHRLLDEFGGLSSLIDAPFDELAAAKNLSENSAVLLKLIPAISRRYASERAALDNIVYSATAAGNYLLPYFHGATTETARMLCLDAKGKVLGVDKLSDGDVNTAQISMRRMVAGALKFNASAVVLAHNHTSGIAVPSQADIASTERISAALAAVDVALVDHLVVAEDDFVSMAESGRLFTHDNVLIGWGNG